MNKYIVFMSNKNYGIISADEYWRYCYENEITPILYTVITCSCQWIYEILRLCRDDKETFIEVIKEEMSNNLLLWNN